MLCKYLSGASLCLKHNVALEPDKAMINDDDNDGDDGDNHGDDGEAGDEVIYAAYGIFSDAATENVPIQCELTKLTGG